MEPLRASRRRVLYRGAIVCVFSALGHNPNNPQGTTFEYTKHHPATLQEAFGFSQGETAAALDPRPSQPWIKLGSRRHGFSVAEAELLVSDETVRKLLREDEPTSIQDAIYAKHNELGERMQAVEGLGNLPNPNNANPVIAAEVVRVVEHYRRLNVPSLPPGNVQPTWDPTTAGPRSLSINTATSHHPLCARARAASREAFTHMRWI